MNEYEFLRGLVAEGEDEAALACLRDRGHLCQMMNAQAAAEQKASRCKHPNTAAASAIRYAPVWCPDCNQMVVLHERPAPEGDK